MSHTRNTRIIEEIHEQWARDHGYRSQAASVKPEDLHAANTERFKHQASQTTSRKRQAPSVEAQASSHKRRDP